MTSLRAEPALDARLARAHKRPCEPRRRCQEPSLPDEHALALAQGCRLAVRLRGLRVPRRPQRFVTLASEPPGAWGRPAPPQRCAV